MRKYLLNLTTLLCCVVGNLFAQSDLQMQLTNTAPIIDGVIDEAWNKAESSELENYLAGEPTSASDFSAYFKTLWDEDYLYVLVDVTDDQKIKDSDAVWQDDAIEIYVDINNDKLSTYGADDYQFSFRWNDVDIHVDNWIEGVSFVVQDKDNGYVLEVRFPWNKMGATDIEAGLMLGFDVHVHDDDDGGDRDNKLGWFTTVDQTWSDPSLMAIAELVGEFEIVNRSDKPEISVSRGFYKNPFDVTISTSIYGMQIYYTLDGSDPRNSNDAILATSPVTLRIDPNSVKYRGKTPGVILRAASIKEGYDFSDVATRTYLFVDKVKEQTNYPGHDWPDGNYVNDQEIDLVMDPDVINDPRYSDLIDDALLEIPTFSIVTDNENLFDPQKGIYVNAWDNRGEEWERPASVELIYPNGEKGFQIDAGLRIRGGWSRNGYFRKHAFRLFFRGEYGEGKLNYPLFGDEGTDSFDKIDLRCSQNYSWSKGEGEASYCTFNRDVFSRDLQREMGNYYTRSRYYHLYVNGQYWGLFQTQERSESSFAATYMGGDSDDYDVIKHVGGGDGIEANDGTIDAWKSIWDLCQQGFTGNNNYNTLQGLDANGNRDESLPVLVDIDNLIDYMNVIFYTGNFDAPVSAFGGNDSPNNFYAIYNHKRKDEGFKFIAHDNEHTLLVDRVSPGFGVNENRVSLGEAGHQWSQMQVTTFENFQPQWLHHKLAENEEYRIKFNDRAYELYYNDGILTPEKTAALFINRTLEYDTALIAESARWGDVDGWITYTKDDHWIPVVEQTMTKYFPVRTGIVIGQLKDAGLISELDVPEYRINNELQTEKVIKVEAGTNLTLRNGNGLGSIKYTVDGTDPRLYGGSVSASAVDGGNLTSISVLQNTVITARIYNNGTWSALHQIKVDIKKVASGLQITEIHYNPVNGDNLSGNEYEFIELKNSGNQDVNLTSVTFKGVQYTFTKEKIVSPGEFVVLASSTYGFQLRYGFEPYGEFEGQLDNGGERISLIGVAGDTIVSVKYNDKSPWPTVADGLGFSIVPAVADLNSDWDDGENWRASAQTNGSPGADDGDVNLYEIIVNEVLANSAYPMVDAVELYNPNSSEVNVGGWYLTDNKDEPKKWQIPAGIKIPANGYVVFNEGHYDGTQLIIANNEFGNAFSLSSHGDDIYLFSANAEGDLTGFESSYDFGDSDQNVSVGRHITSTGNDQFVAMAEITLGAENSAPKVGPVVINQIMYHPLDNEFEYLELVNTSNEDVQLFEAESQIPWKVSGIGFDFPEGFSLKAGASVYLVEQALNPSDFRFIHNLDTTIAVFNYKGKLDNGGEEIVLYKSAPQYLDNDTLKSPYIRVDKVKYNDKLPWPTDADGNGHLLKRVALDAYGNDPASWKAALPSVTISNYPMADAVVGVPYMHRLYAYGGSTPLVWSVVAGSLPEGLSLNATTALITGTTYMAGEFPVSINVMDRLGSSNQMEFVIVVAENTVAEAIADSVVTSMNISVSIDVLYNDIDNDGDIANCEVSVSVVPVNGIAVLNTDNTITYYPNSGYTGTDVFTYQINDLNGTSEAQVIIEVGDEVVVAAFESRISLSSDDAEENINTGAMNLTSRRLEMHYDLSANVPQLVAFRFQNINLPKGTKITKAYIQFTTARAYDYETTMAFYVEDEDNAQTYPNTSQAIRTRNYFFENYVMWEVEPWMTEGEASERQRTPDLSAMVQHVIDRDSWKTNNAIAFACEGNGLRSAFAFDGDAAAAPMLHIEYISTDGPVLEPIAIAGDDMPGELNETILLDGNQSYSLDGRLLNYYWEVVSKPEGSSSQLNNSTIVDPSFSPDQFGEYVFTLMVDNGHIESNVDTVTITIQDLAPIADAGSDQTRMVGAEIRLNGSASYDAEYHALSYAWEIIEQPSGSVAALDDATVVDPSFDADLVGTYRIQLIVSDGNNISEADEVVITINENQIPVAVAGDDLAVYTGAKVKLNGDESYDPEEYTLSFAWSIISKPANSSAELTDATDNNPSFNADAEGTYVVQLIVFDGISYSVADEIQVTVTQNNPPVADAGADQEVDRVDLVYLDGSASNDPDGGDISYLWTFVTKPAGSAAVLTDATESKPSFAPDAKGLYTLRLMVSDGITTVSDDVQIVVKSTTSVLSVDLSPQFKVYPNPFFGSLNIEYNDDVDGEVTFELYNLTGRLISRIKYSELNSGVNELNFTENNLQNGVYVLMVKTESHAAQTFRLMYKNQ